MGSIKKFFKAVKIPKVKIKKIKVPKSPFAKYRKLKVKI